MPVYSLPDLSYDYSALEPYISGQIMELHHGKHHATYVKNANSVLDQLAEAKQRWTSLGLRRLNVPWPSIYLDTSSTRSCGRT